MCNRGAQSRSYENSSTASYFLAFLCSIIFYVHVIARALTYINISRTRVYKIFRIHVNFHLFSFSQRLSQFTLRRCEFNFKIGCTGTRSDLNCQILSCRLQLYKFLVSHLIVLVRRTLNHFSFLLLRESHA